jgi:hypothetical protein
MRRGFFDFENREEMKYKMKSLFCLLIFFSASTAFAQPPDTLWTRTFGGPYYDWFYDVKCTQDGGYIAAGWTRLDSTTLRSKLFVVKTDSAGRLGWTKSFWESDYSLACSILPMSDGYIVIGVVDVDTIKHNEFVLAKLSLDGDSLWSRSYGGSGWDDARSALLSSRGEIAIAGLTTSFGSGSYDIWLLVVSAGGDSLWSRTYGQGGFEQAFAIVQTADGGFALAGETESDGHAPSDMWLVRTNAEGDSLWSHSYGGSGYDEAYGMTLTNDGGFLLSGYTGSFGDGWENVYLVKTDSLGNQQWQRTYGDGLQDWGRGVIQLSDGGYGIVGEDNPAVNVASAWLLRTDSVGDTLWSRRWHRNYVSEANAVALSRDGGYVLAGTVGLEVNHGILGDAWLLKTAPDPDSAYDPRRIFPTQIALATFPNPFNSATTISFSLAKAMRVSLEMFDVLGRKAGEPLCAPMLLLAGEHQVIIDGSMLASGTYFVRLTTPDVQKTQRIVLLK